MAENKSTNDNGRRWERERRELLELIDADFAATASYTGKDKLDPRIRNAMAVRSKRLGGIAKTLCTSAL